MSSVNGVGGGGSDLYSLLQKVRGSHPGDSAQKAEDPRAAMQEKMTAGLKEQGFSDAEISDIQKEIESSVKETMQSDGFSGNPFDAIQGAVDSVLEDAGVDTALLKESMGNPEQFQAKFDSMLKEQGIDPDQFRSSLMSQLRSYGGSGFAVSDLFKSFPVGSGTDVYA